MIWKIQQDKSTKKQKQERKVYDKVTELYNKRFERYHDENEYYWVLRVMILITTTGL